MPVCEMPNLFDVEAIPHVPTPAEVFAEYHEANKHVYVALRQVALDLVDRGHTHISINMCFEVVRYQMFMRTTDPEGYKMNNTHRSRYSRMLMENEPRLAGVFETRVLTTDRDNG